MRAFYGGALDRGVLELDDRELVELAIREQRQILGFATEPSLTRVFRHRCAIPQYTVGHARRVERVDSALASTPGLFLAGTALTGPGFGRAAANGIDAGTKAGRHCREALLHSGAPARS